jgi:hypothetical protein
MSKITKKILPATSAQRQGAPRGDLPSKSWRLGRSLAAQRRLVLLWKSMSSHGVRSVGVSSGS